MELRELLRSLGRRLWILVIVPVVAVAIVAYVASQEPAKYAATATVSVSAPSGQEGTAIVNQAVASLLSAAESQGVLATVADKTGVSESRLEQGLNASRVGASELVEISYTDSSRKNVDAVIAELPKAAQEAVYSSSLRQAQAAADLAQKGFDDATAKIAQVEKATGLILPDQEYQAKASEVTQLRVALVTAQTRPETQSTGPLSAALAKAQKELVQLAGKVRQFEQPEYMMDRARNALAAAQSSLLDVQARQTTAESAIIVGAVNQQARSTDVVRRSVSAAVIGLGIAVLLLVLSELLRRSRGASRRGADEPARTHSGQSGAASLTV